MFKDYPDLLNLEELCELLRVGKNKAYELLNQGKLKGYKESRIWKIPKESVLEYIASRAGIMKF